MQRHIEKDDPLVSRLINKFFAGQVAIAVPILGKMKTGQCYANVVDHSAANGGSMQLGWLLTVDLGLYVEATHHAVWRNPEGTLVDVTDAAFPEMSNAECTFIVDDDTKPFIGYNQPYIPSKFLVLSTSPRVKKYIKITKDLVGLRGELASLALAAGGKPVRFADGNVGLQISIPNGDPIHQLNRKINEFQREKARLRTAIDRRHR